MLRQVIRLWKIPRVMATSMVSAEVNRIQGKYMLGKKKLSDRKILYQFLRRIPIQNRTIAYDIVNRDLNEKRESKVRDNNVM